MIEQYSSWTLSRFAFLDDFANQQPFPFGELAQRSCLRILTCDLPVFFIGALASVEEEFDFLIHV